MQDYYFGADAFLKHFSQASSDTVNMSFKISAVDKFGKHVLLESGNCAGIETELVLKFIYKSYRQNHISYTKCRRDCF